jgi:hypothetical protein
MRIFGGQRFAGTTATVFLFSLAVVILTTSPSSAFAPSTRLPRAVRATQTKTVLPYLTSVRSYGPSRSMTRLHSTLASASSEGEEEEVSALSSKSKGFLAKLKSAIPPKEEREKLLPLGIMFFCILFSYTVRSS